MRVPRLGLLLALAGAVALWRWCPVKPAIVLGRSMTPTLHTGQWVAIDHACYRERPVRRGEVIAFFREGHVEVKRVYALPGERVLEVRSTDVDGVFLASPDDLCVLRRLIAGHRAFARLVPVRVPPGTVYVLGDGGNASCDSRRYGPVPVTDIIGRVMLPEEDARSVRTAFQAARLLGGS